MFMSVPDLVDMSSPPHCTHCEYSLDLSDVYVCVQIILNGLMQLIASIGAQTLLPCPPPHTQSLHAVAHRLCRK